VPLCDLGVVLAPEPLVGQVGMHGRAGDLGRARRGHLADMDLIGVVGGIGSGGDLV
jgi:hypothetical protein